MDHAIATQMIYSALMALTRGGDVAGANAGAVEKFQALMNQPNLIPPGVHHDSADVGTIISQAVSTQDAAAEHVIVRMTELSQQAQNMDMLQFIAESGQLAMEMGFVQFDFQAKMSVVTSSKSSVETLMKNQ